MATKTPRDTRRGELVVGTYAVDYDSARGGYFVVDELSPTREIVSRAYASLTEAAAEARRIAGKRTAAHPARGRLLESQARSLAPTSSAPMLGDMAGGMGGVALAWDDDPEYDDDDDDDNDDRDYDDDDAPY